MNYATMTPEERERLQMVLGDKALRAVCIEPGCDGRSQPYCGRHTFNVGADAERELTRQEKVLVSLVEKWRADGEFWDGVPEHAAFQACADELLHVLGFPDKVRRKVTRDEKDDLLASVGIASNVTDGRTWRHEAVDVIVEDEKLMALEILSNRLLMEGTEGHEVVSDAEVAAPFREKTSPGSYPFLKYLLNEIGEHRAAQKTRLEQHQRLTEENQKMRAAFEGIVCLVVEGPEVMQSKDVYRHVLLEIDKLALWGKKPDSVIEPETDMP